MKDVTIKACKEVIELMLKAVDEYIEEVIEPISQIGSPEKLLGKKYEEWTPQDLQMMSQIYGEKLEDFIFKREYEKVKELENG
uniref:Uncharacterized protein n=1 Tax=viral metagenome TaxID=1070528 RepID=A0A6M3IUL9_9ZZZZ